MTYFGSLQDRLAGNPDRLYLWPWETLFILAPCRIAIAIALSTTALLIARSMPEAAPSIGDEYQPIERAGFPVDAPWSIPAPVLSPVKSDPAKNTAPVPAPPPEIPTITRRRPSADSAPVAPNSVSPAAGPAPVLPQDPVFRQPAEIIIAPHRRGP